jgi:hypothetical protein
MKLAFLILTHNQIELVYRQINALCHPDHHFFIHLDKKCKIRIKDEYEQHRGVHFAANRIRVNWGGVNMVRATLNLIQDALASGIDFDYFILMSDHCFPIKTTNYIQHFLEVHDGFSFIEIRPLPDEALQKKGFRESGLEKFYYPVFFDHLSFIRKDNFVFGNKVYQPKKLLFRCLSFILRKTGCKRKIPLGMVPCFGSQWWTLHRNAIHYVLNYLNRNPKVLNLFKYAWAPDELFFHTILFNSPLAEKIKPSSLWYIDWSANGPPKTLNCDDFDAVRQSGALLARKFDLDKSRKLINSLENLWQSTGEV